NQSAFINKLYTMLEEADQNLISWDQTGTFFIVKNTTDFSKTVLPLYFKHNNFASFVRQLNMYGFHKINDSFFKLNNTCSEVWEFKHHDFRRGEFALLSNIKRKAPKSSSSGSKSTYATTRPYSNHT
ncbi:winged helix DNA-binding domain-containing protein, partial [Rhizoclosmatium globosum]